ncbi:hypothetical protein RRU94_05590 [Domibacillus sp. DTU_2020_1001157_1_SI_ALB_TIR_016]|uniref:hypothetical protein n=1 Tax=Domibacillus sp. DTU_2020_1001157_1_SI_ALB_TIR_016 TaxID=3077789 RepID=UPI0028E60B84|nr:hypothetical protein [Domibacillus sp. DTU_2020_1001157_1_SI_ALB_TIR_016]WNS77947.1 hypothetical protein RRU94_05590 [Domibacillus sp. DTU_2020_1001157_1_SI_ALB_TIR_016]
MKTVLGTRMAGNIILAINTAALFMHILILLNILPYDFVWGGRLKSQEDLIIFEAISILVQTVFILIVAVKLGYFLKGRFKKIINVGLWTMCGIMVLNSAGNAASNSDLEKLLMTPLTVLLALLVFRLAIEKESEKTNG